VSPNELSDLRGGIQQGSNLRLTSQP